MDELIRHEKLQKRILQLQFQFQKFPGTLLLEMETDKLMRRKHLKGTWHWRKDKWDWPRDCSSWLGFSWFRFPYFTLLFGRSVDPEIVCGEVFRAFAWLRYFSSFLNPFINAYAMPIYRKNFRKSVSRVTRRWNRRTLQIPPVAMSALKWLYRLNNWLTERYSCIISITFSRNN